MESHLPEVGALLAGRYQVCGTLGEGAQGCVLLGEHVGLGYPVAIKLVSPERSDDPVVRERFRREAVFGARLGSEHVARVLEAGETDDGLPFLVMEMVEGPDLAAVLEAEERLPVAAVVDLCIQLCAAVSALEAHELVHRDIKPSNVVLKREANDRVVAKLVDLGISRDACAEPRVETLTGAQQIVGTPHYMAPEQIEGAPIDHRADLYAIAAVGYQALAGRPPYEGQSAPAVLARALTGEREPLRALRPDVPDALAKLLDEALAVRPEDRPSDAATMSRRLRRIGEAEGLVRGASAWAGVTRVRGEPAVSDAPRGPSSTEELLSPVRNPFTRAPRRVRRWLAPAALAFGAAAVVAVAVGDLFASPGPPPSSLAKEEIAAAP